MYIYIYIHSGGLERGQRRGGEGEGRGGGLAQDKGGPSKGGVLNNI